jgi:hypothetical protein
MIKYVISYWCGSEQLMRWMNLFLACQHLNSGTNVRECEDQSWFKVQAVPVFRFDWCKMFSRSPGRRSLIYGLRLMRHSADSNVTRWTNEIRLVDIEQNDCMATCSRLYTSGLCTNCNVSAQPACGTPSRRATNCARMETSVARVRNRSAPQEPNPTAPFGTTLPTRTIPCAPAVPVSSALRGSARNGTRGQSTTVYCGIHHNTVIGGGHKVA